METITFRNCKLNYYGNATLLRVCTDTVISQEAIITVQKLNYDNIYKYNSVTTKFYFKTNITYKIQCFHGTINFIHYIIWLTLWSNTCNKNFFAHMKKSNYFQTICIILTYSNTKMMINGTRLQCLCKLILLTTNLTSSATKSCNANMSF